MQVLEMISIDVDYDAGVCCDSLSCDLQVESSVDVGYFDEPD